MGFFGSLWNGVKTAAAAVVSVPILTPFLIADKLGIIDLDGKKDAKTTQEIAQARQEISKTTSLSEATTVQQVEDISKSLNNYRKIYERNAENVETALRDEINNCFSNLMNRLKTRASISKRIAFEELQRKQQRLLGDIDGTIVEELKKRLSIDDYECRRILDIKNSDEKDRTMKKFSERVIHEVRETLANKFSRTMRQISDDISNVLQNTVDDQERETQRKQKEFDNWVRDMENKTFDKEKAQLEPRIKIYAIEQVEKIFAA